MNNTKDLEIVGIKVDEEGAVRVYLNFAKK